MPPAPKTLIFFTDSFPFGSSETFIENEFPFLLRSFDKIYIVTINLTDPQTRQIPENIIITRIPYRPSFKYKVMSVLNYFNPVLQNEMRVIRNEFLLKASQDILSILFASYAKALEVSDLIDKLIAEYQIDPAGLYLYSYWMNDITTGLALYKKRHPAAKAFCRVHRWDVYFETQTPPYLPLRNFIISTLDKVFCISNDAYGYLTKLTAGRYPNRLTISRLGTFNPDKIFASPGKKGLKIVSCSNLIPLKRVQLITDALALIDDIEIDWKHFGKGPLEQDLKKTADEMLGHKKNIKYRFMGQVSNSELLAYYKNNEVDMFINVSETEGIPVSIIEASSFGIPVIGTLVGGVGEILEEGENGFLLNPSCTPQEVAQGIKNFYQLPTAEKERIRHNGVRIWGEKYSAEKNYAGFLQSVMQLPSGGAV